MLTELEVARISNEYAERFDKINTRFIQLMGEHIKEIGTLTASDVHRLQQLAKYGANINVINQMIANECNKSAKEISALYSKLMKEDYSYAKELYLYKKGTQIPLRLNKPLQNHLKTMSILTKGTFANLSKTTVLSDTYRTLVDTATQAVSSGVQDYGSVIRDVINKNRVGTRVTYKSGLTRRLDSAVRMNVLGGLRQMNMGTRQIMGKQFGADGVEIDAHALCAEDHIDVQGRQYTLEEFEELQETLDRPIGEMNCKHSITPIIIGLSERTYSDSDLEEYRALSEQIVVIDGKQYSRYQCSQIQRQLETRMRYAKDNIEFARSAGLLDAEKEYKKKLNKLRSQYRSVSKQSGLAKQYNRAYVKGYRK